MVELDKAAPACLPLVRERNVALGVASLYRLTAMGMEF